MSGDKFVTERQPRYDFMAKVLTVYPDRWFKVSPGEMNGADRVVAGALRRRLGEAAVVVKRGGDVWAMLAVKGMVRK